MSIADLKHTVLEIVRDYPVTAAAIVFSLAFGESLAFVSLILPFFVILLGIGTVITAFQPAAFWTIVVAASVGAALGDWLSYWLGYHYRDQVKQAWPIKNYPDVMEKAHAFFARFGAWAIVLARFSGPFRASVPIVAGVAGMPFIQFQIANWSSAFVWAYLLLSGFWMIHWVLQWLYGFWIIRQMADWLSSFWIIQWLLSIFS